MDDVVKRHYVEFGLSELPVISVTFFIKIWIVFYSFGSKMLFKFFLNC